MSKINHKHVAMSVMMTFTAGSLAAQQNAPLVYPVTKKVDTVDDYHGKKIADPYRWLEDDHSAETKEWVDAQNKVTQDYLATIPFRGKIKQRLEALWNYPRYGSPFREGQYYYFYKNDGLQNQAVLYRQLGLDGAPEVFIDPNKLSDKGTAALGSLSFSKDGKYLAYLVAKAGSDWQEAFVMDVATKQLLGDRLDWIKFSGLSWKGDGFYYSRYDKPDEKSKLSKKNEFHKVYYHKMGTTQEQDELIYVDKEHPLRNAGVGLTEDERFLILSTTEGTSGRELWYRDLQDAAQKDFALLVKGFDYDPGVIENVGDKLLMRTNHDAPNFKVVLVDPKHPAKENWKVVIPEQKEVLLGVGTAGGRLFANYLKDASSRIEQYDFSGKLERSITLPGIGTAGGFGGKAEDKTLFYTFTSYIAPPTIYKYDIQSGASEVFRKTEVKFNPADYETKQVFFTSKDGTKVPMFLSYKKGIRQDGKNPVLLYGYGGFNIPSTPSFSVSNLFFMEQGGIYAVVNLRGGNEYGEAWHKGGMLDKKQNVFDDFIGAAEYLISTKYTVPGKLAIRGGSNGGLLVGACMTQRPDLFKVALPAVGVLDMLRYQKFTIGWAWAVEYGSSEKPDQFQYLVKYSPLHNLKKGTQYPATLITTADHDDRVVPAHSFKFASALQEAHKGSNPVLIRVETQAGHGAGKPTSKLIEEATDIWAFVMYNLGMKM
ncbi:prolyl oligopeptidase family serine peptidase [Chitinophaga niabensis]|uniref:prolyl oligopeptidase n=1 Tax=Chitinophaga niabensis TaxID=536979 RepID=A0A1N6D1X6_9BACT|nr:prolyl oligopeptidase family serine peptidase [Chitinophaga niabensis]SIN64822.1 prolyl oligopeptidase Serine peptidase. MEROPS family S09A [Chitinophaga niabensis]